MLTPIRTPMNYRRRHGEPARFSAVGAGTRAEIAERVNRIRLIRHTSAWVVGRVGGRRYRPAQSKHAPGCGEAA